MTDLEERVAKVMAAAILAQPRCGATFDESNLMIADDDSNSFWELLPVVKAAIEAITDNSEPCGVCGCLVYPSLPNRVENK